MSRESGRGAPGCRCGRELVALDPCGLSRAARRPRAEGVTRTRVPGLPGPPGSAEGSPGGGEVGAGRARQPAGGRRGQPRRAAPTTGDMPWMLCRSEVHYCSAPEVSWRRHAARQRKTPSSLTRDGASNAPRYHPACRDRWPRPLVFPSRVRGRTRPTCRLPGRPCFLRPTAHGLVSRRRNLPGFHHPRVAGVAGQGVRRYSSHSARALQLGHTIVKRRRRVKVAGISQLSAVSYQLSAVHRCLAMPGHGRRYVASRRSIADS